MADENQDEGQEQVEAEVVLEAEPPAQEDLSDLEFDVDEEFDVDLSLAGREALRGAAEGLKRAVSSGIRTVLAADETLRETLPREVPAYVARQLEATRKDLVEAIAQQTRVFLENVDIGGEIKRHLQEGKIEVTTSIRFVPDDKKAPETEAASPTDTDEDTEEEGA